MHINHKSFNNSDFKVFVPDVYIVNTQRLDKVNCMIKCQNTLIAVHVDQ